MISAKCDDIDGILVSARVLTGRGTAPVGRARAAEQATVGDLKSEKLDV